MPEHEDTIDETAPERVEPQVPPEDLSEGEHFPSGDQQPVPDDPNQEESAPEAEPPQRAEPGVYVCVKDTGEHAVLGTLHKDQEYDYSHEQNPAVLEYVAAYVEGGVLEKKD